MSTASSMYDPSAFGAPLWNRAFTQHVDKIMTERFGIGSLVLMETAGRQIAAVAMAEGAAERPVIVLAGPGNNGGDALVTARCLADAGCDARVWLVPGRPGTKNSASFDAQLATLRAMNISAEQPELAQIKSWKNRAPVIIDGVLGLGFSGRLDRSVMRDILEAANSIEAATVVAVDVPSGFDVDDGNAQDVPLKADVTVTFGGAKIAQVLSPAREVCGRVLVVDIGFLAMAANAAEEIHPRRFCHVDPDAILELDPWGSLSSEAHKYSRGHVLVLGGSPGKTGAPIMAGLAALRMGAGWATVSVRDEDRRQSPIEAPPDITFENLWGSTCVDPFALESFLTQRRVRGLVVGPGCVESPLDREGWAVVKRFVADSNGFVVVDAGATRNFLCEWAAASGPASSADRVVVTPHPGEWQRLGISMPPPLLDGALTACRETARNAGVSLLYKGATPVLIPGTDITSAFVTNEGSAVLARAGSGDVLAGAIAAHGVMGLPAGLAAMRAQVVVARAASMAARELGQDSVLATDVALRLGRVAQSEETKGCSGGGCCHGAE